MTVTVCAKVIDALLLGVGGRRRELQDFPVLGDVWARFAEQPGQRHDLLLTPTWEMPSGEVARLIAVTGLDGYEGGAPRRKVAYLQDLVVTSLTLEELVGTALAATKWWDRICDHWDNDADDELLEEGDDEGFPGNHRLLQWIAWELDAVLSGERLTDRLCEAAVTDVREPLDLEDRQTAKLGLLLGILGAAESHSEPPYPKSKETRRKRKARDQPPIPEGSIAHVEQLLGRTQILYYAVAAIRLLIDRHTQLSKTKAGCPWNGIVFQVSLNRSAAPATGQSVGSIKADAARSLFSINCKEISWGILDSGIDQTHPAFWDYEKIWNLTEQGRDVPDPPPHRIKSTFDFRRIRAIMSVDAVDHADLVDEIAARTELPPKEIQERLAEVAADRKEGRRINWARVRKLIELSRPDPPPHPHGTHVAGIIGAHWRQSARHAVPKRTDPIRMEGVCPDITLYDFRVLGSSLGDSEFAVIAAIQFIRFLNDQSGFAVIDGVNMSLSIPHNVRNYACGRTQVCVEAEALSSNGVVVVAAAGNRGFQQYRLADNTMFESYAASSITDPGNAEGVITVGATHRDWPHTYGVSFFSSRGPTGDGRMKPDLLAPGEKITSCVPGGREDQMDGTSMAAPHVSGAAALLMARHRELRGRPARIKQVLCETATDLNRERSFQGYGMVDVLRAIQSI